MEAIVNSENFANALAEATHGLEIRGGTRVRLSAACLYAAMDHHFSIIVLFKHNIPSPALALLRCIRDCYVRGGWLANCASDDQVADFEAGRAIPGMDKLLWQLEKFSGDAGKSLSNSNKNWGPTLHGLTHGGIELARRNLTEDGIERNCSEGAMKEALNYANAISGLAAVQVAALAGDMAKCEKIFQSAYIYLGPDETGKFDRQ